MGLRLHTLSSKLLWAVLVPTLLATAGLGLAVWCGVERALLALGGGPAPAARVGPLLAQGLAAQLLLGLLASGLVLLLVQRDAQRARAEAHERLQLQAQLEQRLTELSLLSEVAGSLTSTLELEELLARIARLVHERLGLPQFSVMLLRPDGALEVKSAHPPGLGTEGLVFALGEGACGRAAAEQRAVYVPDIARDTRIFVHRHTDVARPGGSVLCLPMVHAGQLLGVLNLQRPEPAAFGPDDLVLLSAVADLAATAVRNARLHEETVALALTDPLTGLTNRRHLLSRLEEEVARAARFGHPLSVLMVDIDHFKHLNDTAGHRAGDETLREVAGLLRGTVRRIDTVARYGGEEFLLLLAQVDKPGAVEVADKLRRRVEAHTFASGARQPEGRLTISVGVASLPEDATTHEALVDCADAALYASKRAGRNRITAWAPGMALAPRAAAPPAPASPRARSRTGRG